MIDLTLHDKVERATDALAQIASEASEALDAEHQLWLAVQKIGTLLNDPQAGDATARHRARWVVEEVTERWEHRHG